MEESTVMKLHLKWAFHWCKRCKTTRDQTEPYFSKKSRNKHTVGQN